MVLGYMIKDRLGQPMYGTNTHLKQTAARRRRGRRSRLIYRFRFPMNLGPGSYSVATAIVSTDTHLVNNYEWRDLALVFTVMNMRRPHFEGSAWLDPAIDIVRTMTLHLLRAELRRRAAVARARPRRQRLLHRRRRQRPGRPFGDQGVLRRRLAAASTSSRCRPATRPFAAQRPRDINLAVAAGAADGS